MNRRTIFSLLVLFIFGIAGLVLLQKKSHEKQISRPGATAPRSADPATVPQIEAETDTETPPEGANELLEKGKNAQLRGDTEDALRFFTEGSQRFPLDPRFFIHLGLFYYDQKDFSKAIPALLQAHALFGNMPELADDGLYLTHWTLTDSYNAIGQKHYFTSDLSLRIIHHLVHVLDLPQSQDLKDQLIEFLRSRIGHYDVASLNENVKMIEEGGDGSDFTLPDDGIPYEEKISSLGKGRALLTSYDQHLERNRLSTTVSDRTIDEIFESMAAKQKTIDALHLIRTDTARETPLITEELWYQAPDLFKVKDPEWIYLLTHKTLYTINPVTKETASEEGPDIADIDLFKSIGLTNFIWLSKYYTFNIEKIVGCPEFLQETYTQLTESPELYILRGLLKNKDNSPYYPEVPRIDFYIDTSLRLVMAIQEYWQGVLGSGKELDMAREIVVKDIRSFPDTGYLPVKGTNRGLINELKNLNERWEVSIQSLNEPISPKVFSIQSITEE